MELDKRPHEELNLGIFGVKTQKLIRCPYLLLLIKSMGFAKTPCYPNERI